MRWFKWAFGRYRRVSLLKVDYELIIQSGKSILTINENYKPDKDIYGNFGDFGYFDYLKKLRKKDDLVLKFDKKAKELLDLYQKNKRNKITCGFIDGGDYIVKCIWDLWIDTEYINYDEAKLIDEREVEK